MPTVTDLAFSFFLTWVVGLSPALIARYAWKKEPLSGLSASFVAGVSCIVFAFGFLLARSAAGEAEARISPAWILVFIVSRWIMTRETKPRLSREEIIFNLQNMMADPETSDERRAFAEDRLRQYELLASKSRVPTGAVSSQQQSRARRYGRPAA